MSLIPGSGRCPGRGNGNPPQYSCLGNPEDFQRSLVGYSSEACKTVGNTERAHTHTHTHTLRHTHSLTHTHSHTHSHTAKQSEMNFERGSCNPEFWSPHD